MTKEQAKEMERLWWMKWLVKPFLIVSIIVLLGVFIVML